MAVRELTASDRAPSMPNRIVIDFLEGTTRRKDAIAFAKGFIDQHFDSPQASGWFVARYDDGFAFEAQEGGSGRAYLPDVLDALNRDQDVTVAIRMARRMMEVKRTHAGAFTSIILPEGMQPTEENVVFAEPGPQLTRYKSDGVPLFATGLAVFSLGLLSFLVTLTIYAIGWLGQLTSGSGIGDPATLPISKWEEVMLGAEPDQYVKTLRFDGRRWEIDRDRRRVEGQTVNVPPLQPLETQLVQRQNTGVIQTVTPSSTRSPYELYTAIPRLYTQDQNSPGLPLPPADLPGDADRN